MGILDAWSTWRGRQSQWQPQLQPQWRHQVTCHNENEKEKNSKLNRIGWLWEISLCSAAFGLPPLFVGWAEFCCSSLDLSYFNCFSLLLRSIACHVRPQKRLLHGIIERVEPAQKGLWQLSTNLLRWGNSFQLGFDIAFLEAKWKMKSGSAVCCLNYHICVLFTTHLYMSVYVCFCVSEFLLFGLNETHTRTHMGF